VSSTPAEAALDVPRSSALAVTFNAAPDPSSIHAGTVSLLGPQGNHVPGALSVSGNDVKLLPDASLPGGTKYTLNVAASVKDSGGRSLNAAATRAFTTMPQAWDGVSRTLAEMAYFTSGIEPVITIDKLGDVTAIWQTSERGYLTVFASRMDHRSGNWSVPVRLYTVANLFGGAGGLRAVADASGNVYVVWGDSSNAQRSLLMVRYVAATSAWTAPVSINGLPGGAVPDAAVATVDGQGVLTVVMRSDVNGLYSTRYNPASGTWSTPSEILPPAFSNYIFNLDLVADNSGNLTLGWVQRGGDYIGLNVVRYSVSTGHWGAISILDDNITSAPFALVADVQGGATIAWTHGMRMMDTPAIYAARLNASTVTWSVPVQLSSGSDSLGVGQPAVAVDASGIATVVWPQLRGIFGARSEGWAASWPTAQRIGTATPGNGRFPMTADITGNVSLLYNQDGVTMAMSYSATLAQWMTPTAIGIPPDGGTNVFANSAVSVVDAGGNVTAVWLAQISVADTSRSVVSTNRFH